MLGKLKEVFQVQTQEKPMRVINHKTMRIIIGFIALFMPTAVWRLADEPTKLSSISISYWTDSGDIFVGCLFAVGFFLAAYNGPGKCGRVERRLSIVACTSAIVVALFPTRGFDVRTDLPPNWIQGISDFIGLESRTIHNTFAVSLFVCLFFMLLIFSSRASRKGKPVRSILHFLLGLGMLLGMALLFYILEIRHDRVDSIFYVEYWGLALFGFAWLHAGAYPSEPLNMPAGATKLKSLDEENPDFFVVDPVKKEYATGIEVKGGEQYIFQAEGCWKDWFLHCGPSGWGPKKWNPLAYRLNVNGSKWSPFTYIDRSRRIKGRRLFIDCRRIKGQPFFMLCGKVGMDENENLMFPIGDEKKWTVSEKINGLEEKDRLLYLFANDFENKYENNKALDPKQRGPLRVTIHRLKSDEEKIHNNATKTDARS